MITTIANRAYLPRLEEIGTLDLLSRNAGQARVALGLVGCVADAPVPSYLIPAAMLDRALGNPGNGCIQHGNWLPYLQTADDAIIICIDGDVKMQREMTDAEWAYVQSFEDGQVGIGPNEPKQGGDSMGNELCRIKPILSDAETLARFGAQHSDPIGNAGCVIATRATWLKLWQAYLRRWLDTAPMFAHIAVQQWTLNLCINEGFERVVLPQSFSTHGHWGELGPPYAGWGIRETATLNGEPILFAHKTW